LKVNQEENLYEKLERLVQETNHKSKQEALPLKKARE